MLIFEASSKSCPFTKFSVNPSLSIVDNENFVATVSEIGKLVVVLAFFRL